MFALFVSVLRHENTNPQIPITPLIAAMMWQQLADTGFDVAFGLRSRAGGEDGLLRIMAQVLVRNQ